MSADNFKAPSQVFRWFEKMKSNYEQTINSVLNKFEQYNEKQQARLDTAHNEHITNLKSAHNDQLTQSQATIAQLQADISYFKQQVSQQQHTIEQLNARYDAVMTTFLEQKKRDIDIKAIFDDEDESPVELVAQASPKTAESNIEPLSVELPTDVHTDNSEPINIEAQLSPQDSEQSHDDIEIDEELADKLYQEAINAREREELSHAIPLFQQAAKLGCVKSKGALGRAYFLAEGVEENPSLGLAWLMCAAEQGLPQAIKRVEHFQQAEPELFEHASLLKPQLTSQT